VLLDAILDICGVPAEKFRPICSAIDKLDKMSWGDVKAEMVQEKGLPEAAADKIEKFVTLTSEPGKAMELHKQMMDEALFGDHPGAARAMAQLSKLFHFMKCMGSLPHVSFDLSLARGLDYYTGAIYEFVLLDKAGGMVGTISAGGRYDKLVGMFSGTDIPCVGVSLGIERIMAIAEARAKEMGEYQTAGCDALVVALDGGLLETKMEVCASLWDAGISAELKYEEKSNMKKALGYAIEKKTKFLVMFGQGEIDKVTLLCLLGGGLLLTSSCFACLFYFASMTPEGMRYVSCRNSRCCTYDSFCLFLRATVSGCGDDQGYEQKRTRGGFHWTGCFLFEGTWMLSVEYLFFSTLFVHAKSLWTREDHPQPCARCLVA
jgi:hypothetical protein